MLNMVRRCAEDPVFAAGFGPAPEVKFTWLQDSRGGFGHFEVKGPAGSLDLQVHETEATAWRPTRTRLTLATHPELGLDEVLGCGWTYAAATPVEGTPADLSSFIVAAEDMIVEFLADVAVSPVAAKFLPGFTPDQG